MKTIEFLSSLNTANKGWGLWINTKNIDEHHVGQYSFENDYLPKSFVHLGSLDELAHSRLNYLLHTASASKNDQSLAQEWASHLLSELRVKQT